MSANMFPIGVVSTVWQESQHLLDAFVEAKRHEIGVLSFREGTLDGRKAILADAGIGKVNAAVTATILFDRFRCDGIVFSGTAGAVDPDAQPGDVVVGARLVQHDYGAVVDGVIKTYQPGVLPAPGSAEWFGYELPQDFLERLTTSTQNLKLPWISARVTGDGATRVPRMIFGVIATGDTFVFCPEARRHLREALGAHAVETEGAAVAQVGARFGKPVVVVRAVADAGGDVSSAEFHALQREIATPASYVARRAVAAF